MIPDPYEYIYHSQCGQNSIYDVGNKESKERKVRKGRKVRNPQFPTLSYHDFNFSKSFGDLNTLTK